MITGYVIAKYNRDNAYNIHYVSSLVSAEGGSELATAGNGVLRYVSYLSKGLSDLILQFPSAVRILAVYNARKAYDHNRNNGVQFYHIAGNVKLKKINPIGWILRGKHDTVVAMHTTCSYRDVKKFTRLRRPDDHDRHLTLEEKKDLRHPYRPPRASAPQPLRRENQTHGVPG